MDDLNIRITALLNQATSTSNIKKQTKQIEETLAKTPIQMRIEANTGIAMQEMSKSAKAYQQVWEKAFYNQKQSAIKNANEIKNAYNSQLFQNFNKSVGIGQNTGITEANSALKQYYETVNKLNKVSTIPTSEVIENTFSSNNTNKITKQNSALAELFEKSSKSKVGMSALQKEVVKLNPAMAELNNTTEKSAQSFASVLGKIATWSLATSAIYMPLHSLQQGVDYILDLDNAMNQVQIVTGKTKSQVDDLALSYNKLAKEMSVTTSEIANTSADLYRQGLGDSQVEDRMKGIIEYAKISSISLDDANTIITASANATGESVQKIIDVFSQLGDTTASDASEVGEAMQRVASASENSNISLEKSASWLSTISSISRESASTIGRSLNSIISRYESIKEKGFNEEDATQINDVTKALSAVGINPTVNGQLRDLGEVMDEVGSKWTGLTKNEKAYIATTMAGTYQRNRFITLMNNYDDSLKNYENALNSAGTAEKKFDIYQESAQAHMDKFQASLDSLWQKSFNSDFFKSLIDSGTEFIDVLTNLVNNPMAKFIVVASLGALGGKALALMFTSLKGSLLGTAIGVTALDISEKGLIVTTKALTASLLASPLFWGALAVGSIYAIAKAIDATTVSFAEQKKMVNDLSGELQSLQSEYDQLSGKNYLTDEEQKKLDILDKQIKAKKELLDIEKKLEGEKYVGEYTKRSGGGSTANDKSGVGGSQSLSKLDKANQQIEKYKSNLKDLDSIQSKIDKEQNADKREKLQKQYDNLSEKVAKAKASFTELYSSMTDEQSKGAKFTSEMQQQYNVLGSLINATDESSNGNVVLANSYGLVSDALDKVTEKKALTKKETDQLVTLYPELADVVSETSDGFYIEADALSNLSDTARQSAISQINTQITLTKNMIDQTKKRMSAMQLEAQAQQKIANISAGSNSTFEKYASKMTGKNINLPTDSNINSIAKDNLTNLEGLLGKLNAIKAGSSSLGNGGIASSGSKDKSSSTPSAIEYTDPTQSIVDTINQQVKLDNLKNSQLETELKIAENQKDYTKQIELQNQLLSSQQKTVSDLKLANDKIHAQAESVRSKTKYNTESWFNADNTDTTSYLALLNSFAGKTDDASKNAVEKIKAIHDQLKTLKDGWMSNKDAIDSMNSSMQTTVDTINDLKIKALETQKDALQEIIDLTVELIKKEKEDEKQAIQDKIDAYKDYIDLQKESLELREKEASYDESVDEKTNEIAKLQKQADTLSLDDSREAQTQRADILEQIAEKQKDLNQYQHDDAVEKQQSALDKQLESFENEKDEEIKEIENYLNKTGQLTRDAMRRIDNDGQSLYQDLINYNAEYGSKLENEIVSAWESATKALEQYGSTLNAITSMNNAINAHSSDSTNSSSSKSDVISQMQANAKAWFDANGDERKRLSAQNDSLGASINAYKDYSSGKWYTDYTKKTPLFHNGYESGFVGGNVPVSLKQNELLALLQDDELVFNKDQQERLFDGMNLFKNIVQPMNTNFASSINNNNGIHLTVEAPVTITGNADSTTIKQLEKFGDSLVDKTITKLNTSFNLKGLNFGI